jgi:hypothetical protein
LQNGDFIIFLLNGLGFACGLRFMIIVGVICIALGFVGRVLIKRFLFFIFFESFELEVTGHETGGVDSAFERCCFDGRLLLLGGRRGLANFIQFGQVALMLTHFLHK